MCAGEKSIPLLAKNLLRAAETGNEKELHQLLELGAPFTPDYVSTSMFFTWRYWMIKVCACVYMHVCVRARSPCACVSVCVCDRLGHVTIV